MWLYLAIAGLSAVGVLPWVPWGSIGGMFGKATTGKPDRDAAVKAYDVLKVYSADRPTLAEKLKPIWGELE